MSGGDAQHKDHYIHITKNPRENRVYLTNLPERIVSSENGSIFQMGSQMAILSKWREKLMS